MEAWAYTHLDLIKIEGKKRKMKVSKEIKLISIQGKFKDHSHTNNLSLNGVLKPWGNLEKP